MTVVPETVTADGAGGTPSARLHILRDFLRRPLGVVAGAFLAIVVIAVIAAPWISPYDPLQQNLRQSLLGPTPEHLLGTDRLGRDVLSRLLWGGQISLIGLVEALAVAVGLGIVLGLVAGYVGRFTDNVISRATDLVMAIPAVVLLLMIYSLTDNSADAGMVMLGILSAPTILRVTRGAAQAVREETFVSASRVAGLGQWKIMIRHVLPNVWGPIIVNSAVLAAVILGVQGGLNYLGLGVNPPAPSWGGMVADAQQSLNQHPWLIVPSGLLLMFVIMSLVLVADAIRDATSAKRSRSARKAAPVADGTGADAAQGANDTDAMTDAPRTAVLSVRGLSVAFNGLQVVRGAGFDVASGEALAIVGESGCGKTVTASALLGSLGQDAQVTGSVKFDGTELIGAPTKVRRAVRGTGIGYISQDPMVALDPSFTVANQLGELVGRHDRVRGRARRARVLELLGAVGLPSPADVMKRYPHQLSGGMAQRVAIACALAGRPRVLVADEPTTALDVTVQGEILELLRRLQADTGMAIVLITHDLGVVADLCTMVAVMYAGEVVERAEVTQLFEQPAHPYTRALLASNPMASERGSELPTIAGTVPAPANWPRGCHFYERCALGVDDCRTGLIPMIPVGPADGHDARCIRIGDNDRPYENDQQEAMTR